MTQRELTIKSTANIRIKEALFDFDNREVTISGFLWPDIPLRLRQSGVHNTNFSFSLPLDDSSAAPLLSLAYELIGNPTQ